MAAEVLSPAPSPGACIRRQLGSVNSTAFGAVTERKELAQALAALKETGEGTAARSAATGRTGRAVQGLWERCSIDGFTSRDTHHLAVGASRWVDQLRCNGSPDAAILAVTAEALQMVSEACGGTTDESDTSMPEPPPELPSQVAVPALNIVTHRLAALKRRVATSMAEGDWDELCSDTEAALRWAGATGGAVECGAAGYYRREFAKAAQVAVGTAVQEERCRRPLRTLLELLQEAKGTKNAARVGEPAEAAAQECFRRGTLAVRQWTEGVLSRVQQAAREGADTPPDPGQHRSLPSGPCDGSFSALPALNAKHWAAFATAVSERKPPPECWEWFRHALRCWDAVLVSAGTLLESSLGALQSVARKARYQRHDQLLAWSLDLLLRSRSRAAHAAPAWLLAARQLLGSGCNAAALRAAEHLPSEGGSRERLRSIARQSVVAEAAAGEEGAGALVRNMFEGEAAVGSDTMGRQEILWGIRAAVAQAAMRCGRLHSAAAAAAEAPNSVFRIDLRYTEASEQTVVSIANAYELTHSHVAVLLIRGEHDRAERFLSQALKVQSNSLAMFSAFECGRVLLLRARQHLMQGEPADAETVARHARTLFGAAPQSRSVLLADAEAGMLAADALTRQGRGEEARVVLEALSNTAAELGKPRGGAEEEWPVRLLEKEEDAEAGAAAAERLRDALGIRLAELARGTTDEATLKAHKRAVTSALPRLKDPRERVRAHAALAGLQVGLAGERKRGAQPLHTQAKHLRLAIEESDGWQGAATRTRDLSLQLAAHLPARSPALPHYIVATCGHTLRHHMVAAEEGREGTVLNFGGEEGKAEGGVSVCKSEPTTAAAKLAKDLPPNTVLVAVAETPTGALRVSRVCGGEGEVVAVELPGRGGALRSCTAALLRVYDDDRAHLRETAPTPTTDEFKRRWWKTRADLDDRVREVAARISDSLLGPWRGLVLGKPLDEEIRTKLTRIAKEAAKKLRTVSSCPVDSAMLSLLVGSAARLHRGPRELARRAGDASLLWADTTALLRQGLAEVAGLGPAAASPAPGTDTPYKTLNEVAGWVHTEVAALLDPHKVVRRQHVMLQLSGKDLQLLPWEVCPALCGEPVSRVPGVDWLRAQLHKLKPEAPPSAARDGVCSHRVGYLLNPDGNLIRTQRLFSWFESRPGWLGRAGPLEGTLGDNGIACRPPTAAGKARKWREDWTKAWQVALRASELLVYIGHGNAEQFVAQADVREAAHLRQSEVDAAARDGAGVLSYAAGGGGEARATAGGDAAVCVLTGCSSGRLQSPGDGVSVDPQGMPTACLAAGSPAVVANLWDVTDGEIDRFTEALLRSLVGDENSDATSPNDSPDPWTLADAMQAARKAVRLKYLTGGCPVAFGLPITINPSRPHSDPPTPDTTTP
eukprot:Hpha_TRINITY_DN16647_c1_g1::TRINITY_DN16647_c1_g1_i3::g.181403::m.181403/K02365/ESP1; separase